VWGHVDSMHAGQTAWAHFILYIHVHPVLLDVPGHVRVGFVISSFGDFEKFVGLVSTSSMGAGCEPAALALHHMLSLTRERNIHARRLLERWISTSTVECAGLPVVLLQHNQHLAAGCRLERSLTASGCRLQLSFAATDLRHLWSLGFCGRLTCGMPATEPNQPSRAARSFAT
jgi:hypothetical protein